MTKDDDPEFAFAFGPAGLTPFNSLKYTSEPERICMLYYRPSL